MLRSSPAADGGAIFRRVDATDTSSPDSPSTYSFWSPFTLQFTTPSKERRYVNEAFASFLGHDLYTHFIGCFPGPFFVYNLWQELPLWFSVLWLFLSLVYAPINIYIRYCHQELYKRYRKLVVVFVRFIIPFCFLGFGIYGKPPVAKVGAVIMAICTKSAVPNLSFTALNLRVMFSHHVVIHTVALAIAFYWIPGFCQTCAASASVINKFNEIGYSIDWAFSKAILNRVPEYKTYPCWMISALVIAIFGYLIPTFIVFVAEVSSRQMFLQSRLSEEYQQHLKKFTDDAWKMGTAACITSMVATWFLLSHIRDSIETRGQ